MGENSAQSSRPIFPFMLLIYKSYPSELYSPEDFQNLVKKHEFAFPYEEDFLKLIASIFEGYSQRIIDTGEDDFSGLMIQAVQKMLAEQVKFAKEPCRRS